MTKEKVLRLTIPEGATGCFIQVEWGGKIKLTDGTGELSIHDAHDCYDEKDLEPASRSRQEIIDYILAITHQPCSCTHCQTRKSTLLWAFPGIEKELKE